jgi:hypothetical protein
MPSDGKVVAALLFPPRDYEQSRDLISGVTATVHTVYVLNDQTGALLWQSPLGDLGMSTMSMSANGVAFTVQGNHLLRAYDLWPLVQGLLTGGERGGRGGGILQ